MDAILRAVGVSKTYKPGSAIEVAAVVDITLDIPQRTITLIRGPSGSGKTTLLCLLGTLLRPTSGAIRLEDRDLSMLRDSDLARVRHERIGFIFQGSPLVPRLPAWRNVSLPLVPYASSEKERRSRAMEALGDVDLAERADHGPEELSGGEQQRVAIARALVARPDILLADEPTSNIDEDSSLNLMRLFARLRDGGKTIVVVSHDPFVAPWADRSFTLAGGRLVSP